MSKWSVAVAAVALGLCLGGAAGATEYKRAYCAETKSYCQYKKVVCYQTVVSTETREVPYERVITKYDHCGQPYCVTVTSIVTYDS